MQLIAGIFQWLAIAQPSTTSAPEVWQIRSAPEVRIAQQGDGSWTITSLTNGEFTLESAKSYVSRPGDCFEVNLRVRVGLHTRALPELACYDVSGHEIPVRSSLLSGPVQTTTNWQHFRRVFPVRPGTDSVRARLRASGQGEVHIASLEFRPVNVDSYQTGALISQLSPQLRRGLVLESNLGIINTDHVSSEDRDGDGKWALVCVDLDKLSERPADAVDWRTSFGYQPNAFYWSDGAVLKSDSVREDRSPDQRKALHFRMRAHMGPYRAHLNDPGRAVAVSLDGKNWKRFEGGSEADLGTIQARDSMIELWMDACYCDPVSVGPVYFDYVRLLPRDDVPSAERLFEAASRRPPRLAHGTVDQKRVAVTVSSPRFAHGTNWPVRCGLPIPLGQLAQPEQATVLNGQEVALPSQNRAMATWPDGSVKWLQLDFASDLSKGGEGRYTVAYGNRVRSVPSSLSVQTRSGAEGVEVDTGALHFRVPKTHFGIIEDVRLVSGRVVQRAPIDFEVTETNGKTWRVLDLPVETIEVEQFGPLHAVIRAATKRAKSGEPSSGFYHCVRVHAYAGSPLIDVEYFVANTDERKKVETRSISLKIRPSGRASTGGSVIQATAEANGRGWVSLDGQAFVGVGLQAFREQYPKAIRWRPDEVQVDLWAPEGGAYEWFQGVGKTHQFSLFYGPPADDASVLAHGRVFAMADPAWYAHSGVFGPLLTAQEGVLPAVEDTLTKHMASEVIGKVGLGFENYGDHSSGGYVKGSSLWDNNEYDLPAAAMVHFVRTGDREALRVGVASARHYLDVDTIHYSRRRSEWAGAPWTHSHGTFGHHTAEPPGMSHAGYVQGLIWYSYFTGDPAGIQGARGIADWVLRTMKPEANVGHMERALGHPLMTLTDVYEATWDKVYLRGAARLVDWAFKWEQPERSGFPAPITERPAYYAGSPFCGGLLTSALMKFNSWAGLSEIDGLLERNARYVLTDMWRPPASIMFKGGLPPEHSAARNISTHLRLMGYVYERTHDPLFLVVPRELLVTGYGERVDPFGTRSTGLVFNYLPWFLTTLSHCDNPVPDSHLQVVARRNSVAVAKGDKAGLSIVVRNTGTTPVEDFAVSFQPRLDLKVTKQTVPPAILQPGQKVELRYEVQAPERINLTSMAATKAYAHWSAVYRREGTPHVAHVWVENPIQERTR